ncbi:MAG: alpha-N-arabinofuranosidase [Verrucomicrobia bacterium]|nr:alpha-N-arabinofuranosidase [Verrucomicrobiota bacterium]
MPRLTLHANEAGPVIDRHIFGHFAEHLGRCIYDGLWVGETSAVPNVRGWRADLVAALKQIRVPNLRWPGGCFADDYHWRDGIGPRDKRPRRINAHWGGVLDDNAVGTHEFLDLCEQIGCEPYLAANVGSGSPRELREWVEYCNASAGTLADERAAHGRRLPWKVRLWGIGNEAWGCGGNMTAEYYAGEYRRFATYARDFPEAPLYRIASGAVNDDFRWTDVVMRDAYKGPFSGTAMMQGLSLHFYTVPGPWETKPTATPFDHAGWKLVMATGWKMDRIVRGHRAVMDRYDPAGQAALVVDEWGAWYATEPGTNPAFLYQQQTVRDAVLAALTLNVFINHCERVRIANLAQVVNVLQAVALTEENGGRMVLTPTWEVFALYAPHQGARRLALHSDAKFSTHEGLDYPEVSATASAAPDGSITLTLCNTDPAAPAEIALALTGRRLVLADARVLAAPALTACNTFDQPRAVATKPMSGVRVAGDTASFSLPPGAVAALRFS